MKSFCEILRELREDRDMTQADVANLLGTSQQYYSKYETGKYEMPIHYVVPLADFYGVSVDYLLGRTACRVRLEEYQKPIVAGYTADELLADVLTLDRKCRESVREYIELQMKANRQNNACLLNLCSKYKSYILRYLYPYSAQEAKKRNQLPMWRESYHANVACRNAIEETIRQNFDGMHLKKDCLEPVLEEYGYKRTEWVLATTLQELSWDGRFSRANKQWAARRYIPQDERHNAEITVRSHPAILDGFVDLYREAYQKLGLFGPEHCVGDRAEQDYIGKVLVLSPDTLKESCWSQENQLWYAHDGFGCSPHAIGRSVRCTCLSDGEMTRWNRDEFVGVLDEKFLPDWAKESLSQFQQEEAAESPGMNNQSM